MDRNKAPELAALNAATVVFTSRASDPELAEAVAAIALAADRDVLPLMVAAVAVWLKGVVVPLDSNESKSRRDMNYRLTSWKVSAAPGAPVNPAEKVTNLVVPS